MREESDVIRGAYLREESDVVPTWPVEKPKTYRGGGVSPVVSRCGGGVSLCDNAAPLSSLRGATPFASLDGDAIHFTGRAHDRLVLHAAFFVVGR